MTKTSSGITCRNFLQLLLAAGGSAFTAEVLQACNSLVPIDPKARKLIKNIVIFIQENHSFVESATPTDMCPEFCLDLEVSPHRLDGRGLTWGDYEGIFTSIKRLGGFYDHVDPPVAERWMEPPIVMGTASRVW